MLVRRLNSKNVKKSSLLGFVVLYLAAKAEEVCVTSHFDPLVATLLYILI